MTRTKGLSMEEFKAELEELTSQGLKFDVKSQGSGNVFLSISGCNVSVYQEYEEICGEIIVTKPEADMKISFDFDAVDFVFKPEDDSIFKMDDVKYYLQMEDSMCMSDIIISVSE